MYGITIVTLLITFYHDYIIIFSDIDIQIMANDLRPGTIHIGGDDVYYDG